MEMNDKYFEIKRNDILASNLIAEIISAQIMLQPSTKEFDLDGWWFDIKRSVLDDCEERFTSHNPAWQSSKVECRHGVR